MNKNKRLYVLLPHRGLAAGKSRLAAVLADETRSALNRWLLVRTLQLAGTWLNDARRCVVVSGCAQALAVARDAGATALLEGAAEPGLNAALGHAAAHAVALGAQQLLVLPCDLPRLDSAALDAMLALRLADADVMIAPDRHGAGTNALLTNANWRDFAFGDDSYACHAARATQQGLRVARCMHAALAFDIDTMQDYAEWLSTDSDIPSFLRTPFPQGLSENARCIMRQQ